MQRRGHALLTLGAASAILAVSVGVARADQMTCALRRVTSVPARADLAEGLVVTSTINQVPVEMVVDTGAAYSAVTRNFAARAKLTIEPVPARLPVIRRAPLAYVPDQPANDGLVAENVELSDVVLGSAHTGTASLPLLPGGSDGQDGRPVGILGADYLTGHDIEFDATDGKLNIFEPLRCNAAPIYWSREFGTIPFTLDRGTGRIIVAAVLDGVALRAIIDTGAGATAMPLRIAQRKFDLGAAPATLDKLPDRLDAVGQTIQSYRMRFHRLVIGGLSVGNPTIALEAVRSPDVQPQDRRERLRDIPELIVGIDLFSKLRTMIDYAGGTIYCTKAEPALL